MATTHALKDELAKELAINDVLGSAARAMLKTARSWLDEAEFAEIETELNRIEQRQCDRRRLLGEPEGAGA